MPGLLIKDLPDDLHQRLKESAARHHRSLTKEAMALLEEALAKGPRRKDLPQPFQGHRPVTQDLLDQAKGERR
jgi:plasmid stability protein